MQIMNSGYSLEYNHDIVRARGLWLARVIPEIMRDNEADTIVVSGCSGLTAAIAALAHISFPVLYVRKLSEVKNSHGYEFEGLLHHEVQRYIILDDVICSGATVRRIQDQVSRADPTTRPVGVILYNSQHDVYKATLNLGSRIKVYGNRFLAN